MGFEFLEVPAEAQHVGADVFGGFVEGDEDAGLVALRNAVVQVLHGKNAFAGAAGACHQNGAVSGEAAFNQVV